MSVRTHTRFCSLAGKQYQTTCPTCAIAERVLDAVEADVREEFPKPTLGIQKVLRMVAGMRGDA